MMRDRDGAGVGHAAGCLAVALALLLLGAQPALSAEPIRIGASISTTGTYAKLGRYM